jgi:transketolase C-terminal domain/subunit
MGCWWPKPFGRRSLEAAGVSARVIDMYSIKPLDREAIEQAAGETRAIVVAEEHLVATGLGARVAQVAAETKALRHGIRGYSGYLRRIGHGRRTNAEVWAGRK